MPALGINATWGADEWAAYVLEHLATTSALLRAGARFIPIRGRSAHVPRTLTDGTAVWVDELEEIPSDAPTGDEIVLTPKKLGNVVSLSTESIEDAPVDELDAVGNALTRSVATAIDNRLFSSAAATSKAPAGLLPSIPVGIGPVSLDNIIRAAGAVAGVGGVANAAFLNPVDVTALQLLTEAERRLLDFDLESLIVPTPALPQGVAVVGDARQIVVGVRRDVAVAFSPHAKFTADAVVARVTARADWDINDPRGLVRLQAA